MKKFLSVLLSFAMVAAVVTGSTLTATATTYNATDKSTNYLMSKDEFYRGDDGFDLELKNIISKKYDSRGRLIEVKSSYYEEKFEYDKNNNVTKRSYKSDDGYKESTTYKYDKNGNMIKSKISGGSDSGESSTYTYDKHGNVTKIVTKNSKGKVVYSCENKYTYDKYNRITKWTSGKDSTIKYKYDKTGKLTEYNGKKFYYNKNNQVTKIVRDSDDILRYKYDNDGKLTKIYNENQKNSKYGKLYYTYSSNGLLKKEDDRALFSPFPRVVDIYSYQKAPKNNINIGNNTYIQYKSTTYNGKAKTPNITKSYGIKGYNYKISYGNNINPGKGIILVSYMDYFPDIITFDILPQKTDIKKTSSLKKGIKVEWTKKTKQVTGYQVQCSTDKSFKKNTNTVTVKKNSITSAKLTKLKSKKKYYVRVRTYKTVDGKKYCSKWSKVKTVKTK